jgi:hypothetical protein
MQLYKKMLFAFCALFLIVNFLIGNSLFNFIEKWRFGLLHLVIVGVALLLLHKFLYKEVNWVSTVFCALAITALASVITSGIEMALISQL